LNGERRPVARATRWVVVLSALALLQAACGSTLDVPPGSLTDDGLTAGTSTSNAPTSTTESGGAVATARSSAGRPGTGVAPQVSGPQGSTAAAPRPSVRAPGIGSGTLDIGVYTATGATKLYGDLGLKGLNFGDHEKQAEAVANWINENGGAGGRKLRLVFHDFNIPRAAAGDAAGETQAACEAWTQDRKVYAVVNPIANAYMDQLTTCLEKHGVITLNNSAMVDARFMQRHGDYFYAPSSLNLTRALREEIAALHKRKFFDPKAPVGIVRYNTPEDEGVVADGVLPELRKRGLRAEVGVVDVHGTGNEYQSLVLRFKTLGIKNVLFTWTGVILFAQAAEGQDYHPRYGFHSHNAVQFLQTNVSASQLERSAGIGWSPVDLDNEHRPGPVSSRETLCLKLAKDAGEDTSEPAVAQSMRAFFCDPFLFLKDVLDRAESLSAKDVAAAAESFGDRFVSAATYRTRFGADRTHDGVHGYRVFEWDTPCACFVYKTPTLAMSD
jgi:hypothetical protein